MRDGKRLRALVPVPNEAGRFLLTDPCVLLNYCPDCLADVSVPCRCGKRLERYSSRVHAARLRKHFAHDPDRGLARLAEG